MHLSLRTRFIVTIVVILAALFAVIAYFLVRNVEASFKQNLNASSVAFAELATRPIGDTYNVYSSAGSLRVKQETDKFSDLSPNITGVSVVGLDGQGLLAIKGQPVTLTSTDAATFEPVYVRDAAGVITRIIEPYNDSSGQHSFALVYTVSTAALKDLISRQVLIIIIFTFLALLVSAIVMYELVNHLFLNPIVYVSRMARVVSGGNYTQQIHLERHDEIGDLATSVNAMSVALQSDIDKLKEVDRLKNEFIMITSHNLRTPLTIIKGNLDLVKGSRMSKAAKDMLASIESSARQLGVFSEDMLTIASIEAGSSQLIAQKTTSGAVLDAIRRDFEAMANLKGVTLTWTQPGEDVVLNLSSLYVRSTTNNLMSNAMKFTAAGGTVGFAMTVEEGDIVVAVSDTGIGIAPEEMSHLFTKFHRGTSTLEYQYAGTGIGLYATKLMVEQHGGTITVDSTAGKGSTFTVRLPGVVAATS